MLQKDLRMTTQPGGVRKQDQQAAAQNCHQYGGTNQLVKHKLKLWQTELLVPSPNFKLLLTPRLKRCNHSVGQAQTVGQLAKRALFK
jgi:hypothetical protein